MITEVEKNRLLVDARDTIEALLPLMHFGLPTYVRAVEMLNRIDAAIKPTTTVASRDRWAL